RDRVQFDHIEVRHFADMCYLGQLHSLRIPVQFDWTLEQWAEAFTDAYRHEYGSTLQDLPVVAVTVRSSISGIRPPLQRQLAPLDENARAEPVAHRPVYFGGWMETPIYRR